MQLVHKDERRVRWELALKARIRGAAIIKKLPRDLRRDVFDLAGIATDL